VGAVTEKRDEEGFFMGGFGEEVRAALPQMRLAEQALKRNCLKFFRRLMAPV
jgi:hypothetical protein